MTGTVATVGTFDGVHRGHRAVLAEIVRRARTRGLASLIVTFDRHPLEVVNPPAAPRLLTLPDEKRALLAELGLDRIELLPFTGELARLAPEEFVRQVLRARYGMGELGLGYDHGFGRGRGGAGRSGSPPSTSPPSIRANCCRRTACTQSGSSCQGRGKGEGDGGTAA